MNESSSSSDDDALPLVLVVLDTDCAWCGVGECCLYMWGVWGDTLSELKGVFRLPFKDGK